MVRRALTALGLVACLVAPIPATAQTRAPAAAIPTAAECHAALDARGIAWEPARGAGIAIAVVVKGPLGGVTYSSSRRRPLLLDCSLAVSLAEAGRYLRGLGIERVVFSSAHDVRNVRGTRRPSKHSFGLAIDIHTLEGAALGAVRVDRDYEQGLGDAVDCIGQPMTRGGAVLKIAQCQLVRSGLFHLVLSPDYDDAHHDHLHLEARPWRERLALRSGQQALH
jgi:hypothetical protein